MNVGNMVVSLDFGDGRERIDCCVWDLAPNGVCLMVPPDIELPKQFKIYFGFDCLGAEVMWRRWSQVGVRLLRKAASRSQQ